MADLENLNIDLNKLVEAQFNYSFDPLKTVIEVRNIKY